MRSSQPKKSTTTPTPPHHRRQPPGPGRRNADARRPRAPGLRPPLTGLETVVHSCRQTWYIRMEFHPVATRHGKSFGRFFIPVKTQAISLPTNRSPNDDRGRFDLKIWRSTVRASEYRATETRFFTEKPPFQLKNRIKTTTPNRKGTQTTKRLTI